MRAVYLAHPLGAGDAREHNRLLAGLWVGWIAKTFGVAVVADWIVLSGVWDETPENREMGLACDLALVARCDELWLVGGRISAGMAMEAAEARRLGLPVVDLTVLGMWPPGVAPLVDRAAHVVEPDADRVEDVVLEAVGR